MEETELLEKILEKAMKQGYEPKDGVAYFQVEDKNGDCFCEHGNYLLSYRTCKCLEKMGYKKMQLISVDSRYYHMIFSHDFVRAFWGRVEWTDHLKTMVFQTEPLKYLEKFL